MAHGPALLVDWLEAALPEGFGVSAAAIGQPPAGAYPQEDALVAKAIPARRFELRTGRSCAREALARIGVAAGSIGRDAAGAPVWPAGYTGAISHHAGLAVAVAAPRALCAGVGVDLTSAEPLEPDLMRLICGPDELARMSPTDPDRTLEGKLTFAAKEASIKCLYGLTGRVFGFLDLEIVFNPAGDAFTVAGPDVSPGQRALSGRLRAETGILLAIAYAGSGN